jgi:two-component system NtrC family sensor kinase
MAVLPRRPHRLRSRLLFLVGVLVGLVVLTSTVTVGIALVSRRAIATAHRMELASRQAALLSVIVREQYIHEAHTIILRDRSHVGHHDEWVRKLDDELNDLARETDDEGKRTLAAIRAASDELRRLFSQEILPALDREDKDAIRRAHDRANALVDRMTEQADALATYFDGRATAAERQAEGLLRVAVGVSAALALAAAAVALSAGRSLWRSFVDPLAEIDRVARRVATGDRRARIGELSAAELSSLAQAFDQMLDALGRAEADLVASERLAAIGRIAAGVAHEINNPIAVIRGYVKTMRREATDQAVRDELSILDEEAAACQRIAEDLLIYAHSPETAPVPVRIAELLEEIAERCEEPAGGRAPGEGRRVLVDAEDALISVDPLRIRQVIVNLVNNAREATTGDAPVEVRGRCDQDGYTIEVLDRGAGIADELRDRVFEPFFTTRRAGTGLGLAVCHGLVTAHGGTIRAEPREGGGTRFVVDLPDVLVDETLTDGAHETDSPGRR